MGLSLMVVVEPRPKFNQLAYPHTVWNVGILKSGAIPPFPEKRGGARSNLGGASPILCE